MEDMFLFLQHPPVITMGKRGGKENLVVSSEFLTERHIQVFHVERGGDMTYHGQGQLIVYIISDLEKNKRDVPSFVSMLEEVMIRSLKAFGVSGERRSLNRGVFVAGNKIGSVGIALRKGVTFHGLSLNVNLALEPFLWINPCGLKDIRMTSMEKELTHEINMADVKKELCRHFEDVFSISLKRIHPKILVQKTTSPEYPFEQLNDPDI